MAEELVVRIFLAGLMFLVPGPGADGQMNTGDDTMEVLLLDGRSGGTPNAVHTPLLYYCNQLSGGRCVREARRELAKGESFEKITLTWKPASGSSPVAPTGVRFNDSAGGPISKMFPSIPPTDSTKPAEGEDFDWAVSIGNLLGNGGPLAVKATCFTNPPDKQKCSIVSRVALEEGTVSTCEFVTGKYRRRVASVRFIDPDRDFHRAIAQYMVVELRRPLQEVDELWIQGSGGHVLKVGPNGSVADRCFDPADSRYCADIVISNLSPPGSWSTSGVHFDHYYDLLEFPGGPPASPHRSYPVIAHDAKWKNMHEVQRICDFPESLTLGTSAPFLSSDTAGVRMMVAEDRPICPVGTP